MRVHPLAGLLPPMTDEELADLTADIARHGQREPAVTMVDESGEPILLDGRHRARACEALGIELRTTQFEGNEDAVRALVLSLNVHRRHLTPSQRSLVAGALSQRAPGHQSANLPDMTHASAAHMLGVSERTVRDGALLVRTGAAEIIEAVAAGKLAVSKAAAMIREGGRDRQAATALYLAHRRHSASDAWLTPVWLVERAATCLGGIDGDPAADSERRIPAKWHLTVEHDGLAAGSWANPDGSASRLFINPPYNEAGKGPGAWTRRTVDEWRAGRVASALLLLPARSGARWLEELGSFPRVELTGRLVFEPGIGNPARARWESGSQAAAQFASLLVGIGVSASELHHHFGDVGTVMVRYEEPTMHSATLSP